MTIDDNRLKFVLDDEGEDEDTHRGGYSHSPAPVSSPELNLALKKIAELEAATKTLSSKDEIYNKQEAFQRFEAQYANIDEDVKKYIKTHTHFVQESLNLVLEEKQKKIDAVEAQLAKAEIDLKEAFSYINNLDYRTTTNELSKVAMDYMDDEIDLENMKTKSGNWKKDGLDFVKREYALRTTNDDKFKQRVLNIVNNSGLKPEKREKKLAELMAEAAVDAVKNQQKGKSKSQKPTVDEVIKDSKKEADKVEKLVDKSKDADEESEVTKKAKAEAELREAYNKAALKKLGQKPTWAGTPDPSAPKV